VVLGESPKAKLFRTGKTILVSFGVAEAADAPGSHARSRPTAMIVDGGSLGFTAPATYSPVGAAMVWPMQANKNQTAFQGSGRRRRFECEWEGAGT
jgi:hypothetical protein